MSLAHSHLHSTPSAESPEPPLGAMDTNKKFKPQGLESFGLMTPSPFQSFGGGVGIGGMGMSDPNSQLNLNSLIASMLKADSENYCCANETQFVFSPPTESDIMPKINENQTMKSEL